MPVRAQKRLEKKPETPIYNIGAVSRLTGLAIWTLRWIERHKLVAPCRTDGNQRLYCDRDVDVLNEIRDLMEEGVNLAGVRVIMRLKIERAIIVTDGEPPKTKVPAHKKPA